MIRSNTIIVKKYFISNENKLKKDIIERVKNKIISWEKADIYAISMWIDDNNDNPCEPYFTLGYNTETNFKSQIANASGEIEARWNFAFWLQNSELIFGIDETQEIVKQWIEDSGFTYYDYDTMFGDEEVDENTYLGITDAFVEVIIETVQELHSSGFIKQQFGKEVPIIIHELEYYENIANQNIIANSQKLIPNDFVKFCCGE